MLKGKQGRFRQNLAGRKTIPAVQLLLLARIFVSISAGFKKMALELFKPFIYAKLDEKALSPP
jgi:DNA-directed RNA polymerase subunit beta'